MGNQSIRLFVRLQCTHSQRDLDGFLQVLLVLEQVKHMEFPVREPLENLQGAQTKATDSDSGNSRWLSISVFLGYRIVSLRVAWSSESETDLSVDGVAGDGEDGWVDAAPDAEPAVAGEERGGGGRGAAQEDFHHLLRHQRAVHEHAVRPGGHGRGRWRRSRHEVERRTAGGRQQQEQAGSGSREDDGWRRRTRQLVES